MATLEKPPSREQGILGFNRRVLAQARDLQVPVLERLRFISIVSNNLDEFFEVRIAALQKSLRLLELPSGQLNAHLDALSKLATELIEGQYKLLQNEIYPELERAGIRFYPQVKWTKPIRAWASSVFEAEIEPILTPIALDPAHPFPRILNKSLNFIVELEGTDAFGRETNIAVVQAPRALPRLLLIPKHLTPDCQGVMLLTSIVQGFVQELFPGLTINGVHQFRVTRNSDVSVDDDEVSDKRDALADELVERNFGEAVRLEVSLKTPAHLEALLLSEFSLAQRDIFRVPGIVNLMRLAQTIDLVDRPDLRFPAFIPARAHPWGERGLFATIAHEDVLLHHPYESFQPVLDFLNSAALDPAVIAIKQTVYRTGSDSVLMRSLEIAARAGKEVTVIVELMARFDEETNINWADRLEKAGAHVVYGVVGLKTHAKMALIVRREEGKLKRYAHLGTGNYNAKTATLYEDFSLLTADENICADVHEVFRRLTGVGIAKPLKYLLQAPFNLRERVLAGIRAETLEAKLGKAARIGAKVNALLDTELITALYDASQAGVKIDLIVRGHCGLKPGVTGLSENIRVRSTIGRFLEHSRMFYFYAEGKEEVFLSSADWMDRNFSKRVEIAFPIHSTPLKARILADALEIHLEDRAGTWIMQADGDYQQTPSGDSHGCSAQLDLLSNATRKSST
jgi:polyphosphate kinase